MKKVIAFVLSAVTALSMAGCSSADLASGKIELQDGTYRAEFSDYDEFGWKDFVEVTVSEGQLYEVVYDAENEDGEKTVADIPDTSGKNDPEKALLHTERKTILYEALDELSDEHKEILLLRDINGYSYEEVGERLGLEAGTVKSRLFRAREALRKKLEEKNYF